MQVTSLPPTPPPAPLGKQNQSLCDSGYAASDVITTFFRVIRNAQAMNEFLKLEYIKVGGFGGAPGPGI